MNIKSLKLNSLIRKKEKLANALSLLPPDDKKVKKFRDYFIKKIEEVEKDINAFINENSGVVL